jgi:hypothetical protein
LGSAIAGAALSSVNPAVSAGYSSVMNKGANWLWNAAYDPVNGGMWYGYGFSNCLNLQGSLWPAFGCSGGSASQNQDYAVETGVAFSRQYLLDAPLGIGDASRGDTLYNAAFAAPGYAVPKGFSTNPNYADLLSCCDSFTQTKYYGQAFALGQAASWPAARLGGVQPPKPAQPSITLALAGTAGAVSATVIVKAPSGSVQSFSCSSSPCQISVDARQGDHWYQIFYLDSNGIVINQSEPYLLQLR